MSTHVNITLNYCGENVGYDLRVPVALTTKQFIHTVSSALNHPVINKEIYRIRVVNKNLLLFDAQRLHDYPISDGDIVEIF